jgi:ABC-type transport system involved in cytochrome c biogenesis ATPase subunit
MQSHLADGGLILAATHGSLGLSATQELSLDRSVQTGATQAHQAAEALS